MSKVPLIILGLLIILVFSTTTCAQTPVVLKGTWVVDAKATEEFLRSSPPPPKDVQWISMTSGLMFQMIYDFTDNAITVSAYTVEKKLLYQLIPGQTDKLQYVSEIKQGASNDIWTVTIIDDKNITISSSQSPGTKYFLLKRVKLDPNTRGEDGKRAFDAWKAWGQVLAPDVK